MRRVSWSLAGVALCLLFARPALAAKKAETKEAKTTKDEVKETKATKDETKGDPHTTYNQEENAQHSGQAQAGAGDASQNSSPSTATQTSTDGHWLVRSKTASAEGRWTLYDTGVVKRASNP